MRSRVLDSSFFTDPDIGKLSVRARLLYIGLLCYVDDYGNGLWLPAAIAGAVFPYEAVDITGLLGEVERAGFIARYWVRSQQCFTVRNFETYQSVRHRRATRVPPPNELVNWDECRPKPAPTLAFESSPKSAEKLRQSAEKLPRGIGIGIGKDIDIGNVQPEPSPQKFPYPDDAPGWLKEMQQRRVGE